LEPIQLGIVRGYRDSLRIDIDAYGALPSQLEGSKAENT
jgi:hypothetical protein